MARSFAFATVDVFTDRRFGGNPLAVFPEADGLSDAEMQALAGEFNLAETTFVLPPSDPANTAHVRIFTPRKELPFAGHPNVGTGWVLASRGLDRKGLLLFEEKAGLVRVAIERMGQQMMGTRIAAPQPLRVEDGPAASLVAACAGLDAAADLVGPPMIASVGLPFTHVPVSPDALTRAAPNVSAVHALVGSDSRLAMHGGLYLYAREDSGVRARMFAPLAGIPEDPASGSAAAALAALLLYLDGGDALDVAISQGIEMGRPSLLRATARRDADGVHAWVGGGCIPVMEGRVSL